ncbi:MAG: phosphatidate cytidylyltransferase [Gemmatimonadota bacterium]|nr:phosphatidate cytidylyltransferase [Gemmatimonadota bacterium]
MSELTRRVLFAVVAAPLGIWILLAGDWPLAALLAVASALAAWEFYRMARAAGTNPFGDVGAALAGLVPLAVHAHYLELYTVRSSHAAVVLLAVLAATIWVRGVRGRPLTSAAVTVLGILYTGGLLSFAYALRYHDTVRYYDALPVGSRAQLAGVAISPGGALLLMPVLLTWASDIGAYFVGRAIGGPKLIPAVSPSKTIAGAVGGLLVSVAVTWLAMRYLLRPAAQLGFSPLGTIVFGAVVSGAAQVGDLFESLLKREAGVKDSSALIPGHGGVLDRFDSLLFALPTAQLLADWLLIPAPR